MDSYTYVCPQGHGMEYDLVAGTTVCYRCRCADLERDLEHWKANHSNIRERNELLRDRPDLGDRSKLLSRLDRILDAADLCPKGGTFEERLVAWVQNVGQFHYDFLRYLHVADRALRSVSSWWDELYPRKVFTGQSGDKGAVRVVRIRALIDAWKKTRKEYT